MATNNDYRIIKQEQYIRAGISKDIVVSVQEKPRHTSLGSTDRKAYTLGFKATYFESVYECACEIEPFYSEEETKQIIDRTKEEARHKLAELIYNEQFKVLK